MSGGWELTRIKRERVPEWLWSACRAILPVRSFPFRQLLTRELTITEKMYAKGYPRPGRTLFQIQVWGDKDDEP